MIIRIRCTDGTTYTSDALPVAGMRETFFKENPDATEVKFEREFAQFTDIITKPAKLDTLDIAVQGRQRHFNPNNVVWVEVDMEGEEVPTAAIEAEEAEREAIRAERNRIRNNRPGCFS